MNLRTNSSSRRWILVALLVSGSVGSYLNRAVLAVIMPQVRSALSLSIGDYALALNAFLSVYTIFYVAGGWIADRLGYRLTAVLCVAWWSVASMLHGLVHGRGSLIGARALLGVGEGSYFPAAMRALTERFESAARSKAIAILLCGSSIGMVISPPLVSWITLRLGWRIAFVITGAAGLLLLPGWLAVPASPVSVSPREAAPRGTVALLLRGRKFWCLLGARGLTDAVWFFFIFWLPAYFQEAQRLPLSAVGALLWIPYATADLGALAGAWMSAGLIERGRSITASRRITMTVSAGIFVGGACACFTQHALLALAMISCALFGHMAWSSNLQTAITEVCPLAHVGTLFGLTGAAGTAAGALLQLLFGWIIGGPGYVPAFLVCSGLYLVALLLLWSAGELARDGAMAPSGPIVDIQHTRC